MNTKSKEIKISNTFKKNSAHNLLCCDSLEALPKIPSGYADHCITDPPYNISGYQGKKEIGWLKSNNYWSEKKKFNKINADWDKFSENSYEFFTLLWLKEILRIVKPNGNIIIFGSYHNIYIIGHLLQQFDRKLVNSIVWYKRNAFPNITQRMLCESTEHIIWAVNNAASKAKNWVFNYEVLREHNVKMCKSCNMAVNYDYRYCPYCSGVDFQNIKLQMRNLWDIPSTPKSEKIFGNHPAQKPIAVVERLILGCTNTGDIIIDPFCGSGTVPMVSIKNNRKFLAIEKDSNYCDIALKKINNNKIPLLVT
jgi:site-specific DNA-methyltransferase (adenine-specific)